MFLCIISHHLNYNNKISQSLILKHEPCLQKQLWSADQILIGQKIDLAVKEEKGKVLICNLGPTFAIWGSALLFAININKTQTSLSKNSFYHFQLFQFYLNILAWFEYQRVDSAQMGCWQRNITFWRADQYDVGTRTNVKKIWQKGNQ